MNFDNMPELHWHLGYYGLLGLITVVCTTALPDLPPQQVALSAIHRNGSPTVSDTRLADGADAGHLVGAVRAGGRTERGRGDVVHGVGRSGAGQRDLIGVRAAAELVAQRVPWS